MVLLNTLLARNLARAGSGVYPSDCGGPITSLGHNLIGDPTGCTITLHLSDRTGDPGLATFTDDGTPGNGHVPLLPTSQAIDAGNNAACPRRDQLRQRRIGLCDIGAIEFRRRPPPNPRTWTTSTTTTRRPLPRRLSNRDAWPTCLAVSDVQHASPSMPQSCQITPVRWTRRTVCLSGTAACKKSFHQQRADNPSLGRNFAMTERQKENWSGVLLVAMLVGIILGGLLILRWSVH